MMYDVISEDGGSLEDAMEKVIRFQSFRDINTEVAVDFRKCLHSQGSPRNMLKRKAEEKENAVLSNFYSDVSSGAVSGTALKDSLEQWL